MPWIREEDLKAIRAQADIADIIANYIDVEKKGKHYRALCPFHDDHDPSLHINTDRQTYKCFVCGEGGNVFTFVSRYEHIDFPSAVARVAELIHYPLQMQGTSRPVKADPFQAEHAILEQYVQFGCYELYSEDGKAALDYLHRRKISDEIIRKFSIGLAPASAISMHFLESKTKDASVLQKAGLIWDNEYGRKAVFENRILIPIHDFSGKPVGFTARRLNENDERKYLNTAETPLYSKSRLLFNFHRAAPAARKARRIILVEGAMDVIGLAKAGIEEAVAALGTASTPEQMQALASLHVPVLVCYDSDPAGRKATYEFGKKAMQSGLQFSIVRTLHGKDPDEVYNTSGAAEVQKMVERTQSWTDFLFDWLPEVYNLENYDDLKSFALEISSAAGSIQDGFEKQSVLQRLKEKTGYDFTARPETRPARSRKERTPAPALRKPESGLLRAEHCALYMMLHSRSAALSFQQRIGFFQNRECQHLALYIYDIYRSHDQMDRDALMAVIKEENVRILADFLFENPYSLDASSMPLFEDICIKIEDCSLAAAIDRINAELKQISDPQAKGEKAREKQKLIARRLTIRSRKEG